MNCAAGLRPDDPPGASGVVALDSDRPSAAAEHPTRPTVYAGPPIIALAGLGVAACGADSGGGSAVGTASVPQAPAYVVAEVPAARLLSQATMGWTRVDILRVRTIGIEAWIAEQMAKPRRETHWDWMTARGYGAAGNDGQFNPRAFDDSIWRQLITGEDQLRQRVAFALSEILVVGFDGLDASYRGMALGAYFDILADNAFGNYRTLLEQVSLSPAMGMYLTFLGNRKANPASNSLPDENYARELMQLFTIGTSRLGGDGTVVTENGRAVETYGPADVSGLARVFTGFTYASTDTSRPDRLRQPMAVNAAQHEGGEKAFLGTTIPAGTAALDSLRIALDTLFAHPNLPPFIARQLIQRLVTSNPSPAYVGRIAAVFAGAGGARGDLAATVRAILLDDEARNAATATGQGFGKLREPVMRLTGWARACGAASPSDTWSFGDTSSSASRLGQSPLRSPSVFNFFRPGYTPAGTAIATQGLVAPEFQITNEASVIGYVNHMNQLIVNGTGDVSASNAAFTDKAGDATALVDEANLLLAAGQLGATTLGTIRAAVDSIAVTTSSGTINRIRTAILLTLAAPEFLVQR